MIWIMFDHPECLCGPEVADGGGCTSARPVPAVTSAVMVNRLVCQPSICKSTCYHRSSDPRVMGPYYGEDFAFADFDSRSVTAGFRTLDLS
jgi:hypothetical protein